MKRFSGAEKGVLLVSLFFIGTGVWLTISPRESLSYAAKTDTAKWRGGNRTVVISKATTRGLGVAAMLLGAGFIWIILQKPDKK